MNTQGGAQGAPAEPLPIEAGQSASEYAIGKIKEDIEYYSRSGRRNKTWYIRTRNTLIVVAALTTFLAAMQSAKFLTGSAFEIFFRVATPTSALVAAIVGGLANTFQYGAAWRDAVVTGLKLERELNQLELSRYATQAGDQLDAGEVLERTDRLVFEETEQFFERVVGGASGG